MKENNGSISRGLFFVLTRIILVIILVAVIWIGFSIGQQTMNVYVLTKDAFAKRADIVLAKEDTDENTLNNMYTQNFIINDEILNTTAYDDYKIANYYQRNDVKWSIVMPWQNSVTLDATEEIYDITGEYSGEVTVDAEGNATELSEDKKTPPLWNNGVYKVKLIKVDGSWKIDSMEMVETIEPPAEETRTEDSADDASGEDVSMPENSPEPEQTSEQENGGNE